MYGQMDYELSHRHHHRAQASTQEVSLATRPVPVQTPPALPQPPSRMWFNVAVQIVVLWALVFWIVTFAIIPVPAALAVMTAWTVVYLVGLVVLAWLKRPHQSLLVVLVTRLRGDPSAPPLPADGHAAVHRRASSRGRHPYLHAPPWRSVAATDDDVFSHSTHGARSMETEAPDDDGEDDDVRQAQIEEEMARRDVSIFTVPKRRLVVRN